MQYEKVGVDKASSNWRPTVSSSILGQDIPLMMKMSGVEGTGLAGAEPRARRRGRAAGHGTRAGQSRNFAKKKLISPECYLASWTRAFAVSELPHFVSNPGKPHLKAAKPRRGPHLDRATPATSPRNHTHVLVHWESYLQR